jgi:predicted GIY-YIG superfamily endonuclease
LAYIYQIKNKVNGKIYIGSTNNIKRRWYKHIYELNHITHANKHLQKAWNKYGKDNFEFTVLKEVKNSDQFKIEQQYIDETLAYINGYNMQVAVNEYKTKSPNSDLECFYCEDCTINNDFEECCKCPHYLNCDNCDMNEDCESYHQEEEFNNSTFVDLVSDAYGSIDGFWECNGI